MKTTYIAQNHRTSTNGKYEFIDVIITDTSTKLHPFSKTKKTITRTLYRLAGMELIRWNHWHDTETGELIWTYDDPDIYYYIEQTNGKSIALNIGAMEDAVHKFFSDPIKKEEKQRRLQKLKEVQIQLEVTNLINAKQQE